MDMDRVGYIENVRFVGSEGSMSVKTKCDTGARRTSICESLAEEIGVGDPIDSVVVNSSNGSQDRDVFLIFVEIGGRNRPVEVSVTDRRDMNYDAILGRDVLGEYLVESSETFLL